MPRGVIMPLEERLVGFIDFQQMQKSLEVGNYCVGKIPA